MTTKPTDPKKPKTRSPEHAAATAAIELAKFDAAIIKATETVKAKTAERAAMIAGLEPAVATLVKRMRGEPST